jgi:hypothetical protein
MSHISSKPERGIVAAACQLNGLTFSIPAPARHHDVLWAMHAVGIRCGEETQGFLDHRGVFLGRKTAMIVAHNWDQVSSDEFNPDGELFSEHLW